MVTKVSAVERAASEAGIAAVGSAAGARNAAAVETTPERARPASTEPDPTAPNLTAPNLTAPNLTAPNLTAAHLTAPNLTATRRFASRLTSIAVAALGLRLLHVWFVTRVLGAAQIHDAAYYHDVALALLGKLAARPLTTEVPFANVGYPYVVSWVYALSTHPAAVLGVQSLMGAGTAVLAGLVARDCFSSNRAGEYAAGICALYAPGLHYDGLLLTPSASAFVAAVLLWALTRVARRPSWRWATVAGVAIAAATLLRASQVLLLLAASFGLWVALGLRANRLTFASRLRVIGVVWLTVGACLAPVVLVNRVNGGAWTISANGGVNFWIGNHRGAAATYTDAAFVASEFAPQHLNGRGNGEYRHTVVVERDGFWDEARRRTGQPTLTLASADAYWWQEGLREIARTPVAWSKLVGQKLQATINDHEPRTNASFEWMAEVSPLLRFNPLRFGLLFVLAVFGALSCSRQKRRAVAATLGPMMLVPMFTGVAFFVSGEYRHPAYPALAVLGGHGLRQSSKLGAAVVAGLGARRNRRATLGSRWWLRGCLGIVAAVFAFWPMSYESNVAKDRKAYAQALATQSSDGTWPTRERYAMALALLDASPKTREDELLSAEAKLLVLSNLAIQFEDRNAAEQLIETARSAWQLDVTPTEGADAALDAITLTRFYANLVRRVAQLGRQPFVRYWPDIERTLTLLGAHSWREFEALLSDGDLARAQTFLNEALQLAPRAVPVLAYRGQLAARLGEEPMAWFERSLDGFPKLALPALLLAQHHVEQARPQEAIGVLRAAASERLYDETLRYTLGHLMSAHTSGLEMVAFFSAEASRDEKPQTSHYFVAVGYDKLGETAAAIASLRRALELDPAHEMSQRLWGLILERQGKLVPALEHLVEATRIHPEFRAALLDVARLAARLGHPAKAARWRERVHLADPNTPRRFVYWAKYLHSKGRHEAALSELRRRLEDEPRDAEALALRRAIVGQVEQRDDGSARAP